MLRLKSAICEFENEWLLTFRKATKVVISWYLGEWVYVETKKCVSEYEINKKRIDRGGDSKEERCGLRLENQTAFW